MEYLITEKFLHTHTQKWKKAAMKANFLLAHLLAKQGKPFTAGKFPRSCLLVQSVATGVEDIGSNINNQLNMKANDFEWFSLALDGLLIWLQMLLILFSCSLLEGSIQGFKWLKNYMTILTCPPMKWFNDLAMVKFLTQFFELRLRLKIFVKENHSQLLLLNTK